MIELRSEMQKYGLSTQDQIIADGKLHRFNVINDKSGSKNGWYVFFNDRIPAGAFGSWRTGQSFTWCEKAFTELSNSERLANILRFEEAKRQRDAEDQKIKADARVKAGYIWKHSEPYPEAHPYLRKKGVRCHGLRLYKGRLVIALHDCSGTIHSLQFIDDDGYKCFLTGGRKLGCFFLINGHTDTLCIAEGYATAASIYEVTGNSCAVAFDAGNLKPVCCAIRKNNPFTKIVICADNDSDTEKNVGLAKAKEAAMACGAYLAVPPCAGDFNDIFTGGRIYNA